MVNILGQVWALYQIPRMFPLIIAGSLRWAAPDVGFENTIEEDTRKINVVTTNGQSGHLGVAKFRSGT